MRGERVTMTTTSELRRRRASSEQRDGQGVPGNTLRMISSYELEPLSPPTEVERNDMPSNSWWINLEWNTLNSMWRQGLYLKHLNCTDLSGYIKIPPNSISEVLKDFVPEPLLPPEVKRNGMLSKLWRINLVRNPLYSTWHQASLENLEHLCLTGCSIILSSISGTLKYFEPEPLLPPEVKRNDMPSKLLRINPEKFPRSPERRDAEHDSSTLRRLLPTLRYTEMETMIETGCASGNPAEPLLPLEVEGNDMSTESRRINLEESPALPERRDAEHGSLTQCFLRTPRYTEVETMIETGCASGNPAEAKREWMAFLVRNIASIVLCALMVFASIESKSLSIIASILDPFFDLLWGFILWLTSHAMQNPNPHKYPIGKKRMQPVSEPEKDPQKEKWMIGVMTFVTMVQLMLAFYCRRFENKILRAYAEHHSSNVITNLISVAAAVLAIRYYWWIDPTGAIIILLYTLNTWKKTFF